MVLTNTPAMVLTNSPVQWLLQEFQHFGRLRQKDCLSPEVSEQSEQHRKTMSPLKIQKISLACWQAPVVPAIQEAEAGESLELGRQRLQ